MSNALADLPKPTASQLATIAALPRAGATDAKRWDEVARLRASAEEYARSGDVLTAAMLDGQATRMATALRG